MAEPKVPRDRRIKGSLSKHGQSEQMPACSGPFSEEGAGNDKA